MAHGDGRRGREDSRGLRRRRVGKKGKTRLADMDISYVKMMHFAILEMARRGLSVFWRRKPRWRRLWGVGEAMLSGNGPRPEYSENDGRQNKFRFGKTMRYRQAGGGEINIGEESWETLPGEEAAIGVVSGGHSR